MSPLDLTGQQFGKLTALRLADRQNGHGRLWLCRCECGRDKTVLAAHLKRMVTSCGRSPCRGGGINVNLVGQVFGTLIVLRDSRKRTAANKRLWECKCTKCGSTKLATTGALRSGKALSCGASGCKNVAYQHLFSTQAIRRRQRLSLQKQAVFLDGKTFLSPAKAARYVRASACTLLRWKHSCPWLPEERGIEFTRVEVAFGPDFTDYYLKADLDLVLRAMATRTPIPKLPGYVHIHQAAALLGIHIGTIYQKAKDHNVKPFRVSVGKRSDGRTTVRSFVPQEFFDKLKDGRRPQPTPDTVTRREAANDLGASPDGVRWLVRTGRLKSAPSTITEKRGYKRRGTLVSRSSLDAEKARRLGETLAGRKGPAIEHGATTTPTAPAKRGGRPKGSTDAKAENLKRRVRDLWATNEFRRQAELARHLGIDKATVSRALQN